MLQVIVLFQGTEAPIRELWLPDMSRQSFVGELFTLGLVVLAQGASRLWPSPEAVRLDVKSE